MVVFAVFMLVLAAVFLAFGVLLRRGHTGLIHDYHQQRVPETERRAYGKAMARGMFVLSLSMAVSGVTMLPGVFSIPRAVPVVVLFAGIAVSLVLLIRAQKKYNGGLF